jgi:ribosomal protein L11 methylase PrmA
MLQAFAKECKNFEDFNLLSVGSGSGLFEVPMLRNLVDSGKKVREFIGVDVDEIGSQILEDALKDEFENELDFNIEVISFDQFEIDSTADIILYNHVFEYIREGHKRWIHKSMKLLSKTGKIIIFSPLSGGINLLYEENMKSHFDYLPFYSNDIANLLEKEKIEYSVETLNAECKIENLDNLESLGDGMRLLSFLCQIDCRNLSPDLTLKAADYFQSLAIEGKVPHPADMFVIEP